MEFLIGIDIGTSGTKAVLFDTSGAVMASSTHEYPMEQPHPGWAQQNPEHWWQAACASIRHILQTSGIDPAQIRAVGLTGQMHSLVLLDEQNQVLYPAILWCDQRTEQQCQQLTECIGKERLLQITANPALTGFTAAKILWVRQHHPEVYERCRHILLAKDYIRLRLTGEYATDVSDASGMQLLDVAGRCWSDEMLRKLQIDRSYLAKVYESPEVTGTITKQAAEQTGLCPGTLVVAGAGDNAAAAVGTGTVREGCAFTIIGSSGVVFAHTDQMKLDEQGRVHTFCCAVPGKWHVMGVTQGAGLSLKWFRDQFCPAEIETARSMQVDPYDLMDQQAAKVPIGCNGVTYLPYLMGERTPHLDPAARGVFFGLSASHQKRDLLRAVMEGVSFSLCDCLGVLNQMGVGINRMLACGGGGSSKLWRQMLADIYNLPVCTVKSKEGPALGAALLAGVGAGIYPSVEQACDRVIGIDQTAEPNRKNHTDYQRPYRVYRALYPALKQAFRMGEK